MFIGAERYKVCAVTRLDRGYAEQFRVSRNDLILPKNTIKVMAVASTEKEIHRSPTMAI